MQANDVKLLPAERCGELEDGDLVVFADGHGRSNLVRLRAGAQVQVPAGSVHCDALVGGPPGQLVRTHRGEVVSVFRPTLEQYLWLMPRAAQIIIPKDAAFMVQWADVFAGATVVEAGMGSGGLTLSLLRAVGDAGRVISFESRPEFANRGLKNIDVWQPSWRARHALRLEDVHTGLGLLRDVDRVLLDLADPWAALDGAAQALVPGGVLVAYLPGIRQVDQLVLAVLDHAMLSSPEVVETNLRPWRADRVRLRPESRVIGHTGFLIRTRRLGRPPPGT